MARTTLIQHDWVADKKWRRDNVDTSCVNEGAVIYHPDKKGVLFNDNLVPNGTQGDPAAGGSCESQPHETKDKPEDYKGEVVWANPREPKITAGTPASVETAIKNAINVLRFHSSLDENNKKKISKWLIEANLTKAKSSIKPRKKVRSTMGKRKRASSRGGVSISSDEKVEV